MSKDSPIAQSFNERRRRRQRQRKKPCWKCRTAKMRVVDGEWVCHYCGNSESVRTDQAQEAGDE